MNDYYRSRKLLNLAKGQCCQLCGAQDGTVVSAHSNQSRHGKGMSIKAHDCFVAWLCMRCHAEIDQGGKLSREEKREWWQVAHEKTLLQMFSQGMLAVSHG